MLGGIGRGWVAIPILAGLICFVGLFFVRNVFNQQVYRPIAELDRSWLSPARLKAVYCLAGELYRHRWHLAKALEAGSPDRRMGDDTPANKTRNKEPRQKLDSL